MIKGETVNLDALARRLDDTLNLGGYVGHSELHAVIAELAARRKAVGALTSIVDDVGLYLAGSPNSEDHQVAAAMEQRRNYALVELGAL